MAMQRTALLTLIGVIGYVGSQGALSASAYRGGETRDAAHPFSELRLAQATITPPPLRARGEPAREPASSQATPRVHAAAAAIEPASAQATSRVRAATAAREPASLETTALSSMAKSAILNDKIQASARGKGRSRQ